MAHALAEALKRLRAENDSLHRASQEQERAIMEMRSQLSEERAISASLRKKLASRSQRATMEDDPQPESDEGDFRTTPKSKTVDQKKPKGRWAIHHHPDVDTEKVCQVCGVILAPGGVSKKCSNCSITDGGFTGGSGSRVVRSSRGLS